MRHGIKEDRKGIGTRIRAGNREGNWADNGLYALIYYYVIKLIDKIKDTMLYF